MRTQTTTPRQLPIYSYMDSEYYVDFRLREMREKDNPYNAVPFITLMDESVKADLRGLRAEFSTPCYMPELDG